MVGIVLRVESSAWACPDCAAGIQARSALWSDDFGRNLAAGILPFLVVAAVSMYATTIGRPRPPKTHLVAIPFAAEARATAAARARDAAPRSQR